MDCAPAALLPAQRYRLPDLLQDIRLLDLLELSGTTLQASRLLSMSQPTVSRRYRALARDFGLETNRRRLRGCCYGSTNTMRLLRLGCRTHRLEDGVARIGTDLLRQPLLDGLPWLLSSPPRFRAVASWLELVREGVLDGALISGLELDGVAELQIEELELVPLGGLQLLLAALATGQMDPCADRPPVLVPHRGVAAGLQRALQQQGLVLRSAGNGCHHTAAWVQRLGGGELAMTMADLDAGEAWPPLRRMALPQPLLDPLWLALPADWREQAVLATTVEQLRSHPGLVAQEGP
ncbi:hypothetical protein [Vulcanococcus limneticus]|uniref:hypothetical protein n=1 Tax=Vulcanococcus limneticus TaxID=2170428 RepID=UPI00398BE33C